MTRARRKSSFPIDHAAEVAAREADVKAWEASLRLAKVGNSANAAIGAQARLEAARRMLHRAQVVARDQGRPELDQIRRDRAWAAQDGAWPVVAQMDLRIAALEATARAEADEARRTAARRGEGLATRRDRFVALIRELPVEERVAIRQALAEDDAAESAKPN